MELLVGCDFGISLAYSLTFLARLMLMLILRLL